MNSEDQVQPSENIQPPTIDEQQPFINETLDNTNKNVSIDQAELDKVLLYANNFQQVKEQNDDSPSEGKSSVSSLNQNSEPFYPSGKKSHQGDEDFTDQVFEDQIMPESPFAHLSREELIKELEKCLNINRMHYQYIQDLQKSNMFLKNRIKDLENGVTSSEGATENDYKLMPVGPIEQVNEDKEQSNEPQQRRMPYNQENNNNFVPPTSNFGRGRGFKRPDDNGGQFERNENRGRGFYDNRRGGYQGGNRNFNNQGGNYHNDNNRYQDRERRDFNNEGGNSRGRGRGRGFTQRFNNNGPNEGQQSPSNGQSFRGRGRGFLQNHQNNDHRPPFNNNFNNQGGDNRKKNFRYNDENFLQNYYNHCNQQPHNNFTNGVGRGRGRGFMAQGPTNRQMYNPIDDREDSNNDDVKDMRPYNFSKNLEQRTLKVEEEKTNQRQAFANKFGPNHSSALNDKIDKASDEQRENNIKNNPDEKLNNKVNDDAQPSNANAVEGETELSAAQNELQCRDFQPESIEFKLFTKEEVEARLTAKKEELTKMMQEGLEAKDDQKVGDALYMIKELQLDTEIDTLQAFEFLMRKD